VRQACVIGAGSSGLAVVKALADRGIAFDCFERSDLVGGNWVFGNANGMSSAYRSLCTNSSRTRTQYADHPMPPDYPDFPHHTEMARYFESYAERFGLTQHITFNTTVVHARREAGAWTVTLDTGEQRRYPILVVANGHHWDPRWPEPPIPGRFDGAILHASGGQGGDRQSDQEDRQSRADQRAATIELGPFRPGPADPHRAREPDQYHEHKHKCYQHASIPAIALPIQAGN
jgi:dimethylaniline monooxygenase (N-oxide forming)